MPRTAKLKPTPVKVRKFPTSKIKKSKALVSRHKKSEPEADEHKSPSKGKSNALAICYCCAAIITFCLCFIEGALLWNAIRRTMFGLLGIFSVFLPALFVTLVYISIKGKNKKSYYFKLWLTVIMSIFISSIFYILRGSGTAYYTYAESLTGFFRISAAADNVFLSNGGLLSAVMGYPLQLLLGTAPGAIVAVIIILSLAMSITGISISDIGNAFEKHITFLKSGAKKTKNNKEPAEDNEHDFANNKNYKTLYDDLYGDHFSSNSGQSKDRSKKKRKDPPETPIDSVNPPSGTGQESADAAAAEEVNDYDIFGNDIQDTQPKRKSKSKNSYKFPPLKLLHPAYSSDDLSSMNELQNSAAKLIDTLNSFNVAASITNICRGPSVTRYEIQPAPGVKISRITNLSDDIALNLAANGVRIEAPIPGKAAVGIEVPNKIVTTVSMRELIDSDTFKKGKSKLTCVLGKDISGNIVSADLDKMPHLLIAGTTGAGKSVCVNSILLSILYRASPHEVKMLLIDPKMVEFSKYKGIPHLLVPVVSEAKKAAGALNWAVSEMLQRYKTFAEYDCKNIQAFNKMVTSNLAYIEENNQQSNAEETECMKINGFPVPTELMPLIVIAIDELADLMMAAPNEVEEAICRLAQMARAAGMHLVIATQRPSVNVITGVIKANIPSRISLRVSSGVDSRTILDFGGAEKLIGKGDMLFSPVGAPKPLRVQGCYASDEEIENVTAFIKKSYAAQYDTEIEEKIQRIAEEELEKNKRDRSPSIESDETDSKMEEAIKCVIDAGQASTSLLQRRIKVGYARAGRMIDDMEQMGIVGPHQGSKPREVLMTYQEWLERENVLK